MIPAPTRSVITATAPAMMPAMAPPDRDVDELDATADETSLGLVDEVECDSVEDEKDVTREDKVECDGADDEGGVTEGVEIVSDGIEDEEDVTTEDEVECDGAEDEEDATEEVGEDTWVAAIKVFGSNDQVLADGRVELKDEYASSST